MKHAGPSLLSFSVDIYVLTLGVIISGFSFGAALAIVGSVLGVAFVLPVAALILASPVQSSFLLHGPLGGLWIVCPPHWQTAVHFLGKHRPLVLFLNPDCSRRISSSLSSVDG